MSQSIGSHLRALVVPVYVPMVLLSLGLSAPVAAFPQYLGGLGASVGMVGVVIAMQGVGNMASDLPGGLVLGRFRLRTVVLTVLFSAGVTSAAMALVRSVAVIGALVFVTGFMVSIVVTANMAYVRLAVPAASRGRALSLSGGAIRIGALLGPIAGGVLADLFGVPAALWLRAGSFFLAFALLLRAPDAGISADAAATGTSSSGLRDQLAAIREGLRGRGYALATVGFGILILQLLRTTRNVILPLWGDNLGLSATLIGSVMSIGAGLELALFVPSGVIMDRAGRKVAGSLCVGIFSVGVVALAIASDTPGFILASLLIGLGNGFGAGINMTIGTDLAPKGAVSEFIGLWRLFGDVGSAAGPAIVGAVATAGGLVTAVIATALLGAAGLVALLVGPETLRLASEE